MQRCAVLGVATDGEKPTKIAWLTRGSEVLSAAELASTRRTRSRGLLGRDGIPGVLVIEPCRQVHTLGMRFEIDVAFCARDGRVLRVKTLAPMRLSPVVVRSKFVIEAEAGSFERWGLRAGDILELKQ